MSTFMNVACPACGHSFRVPESAMGQPVKCPACLNFFECGSLAEKSLKGKPIPAAEVVSGVQATPLARGAQPQADANIHFRCPRCAKPLESPAHTAGQKVNCPDCGQRLQIPQPAKPAPPAVNRTLLATEEKPATTSPSLAVPPAPARPPEPILDVIPVAPRGPAPAAPPTRQESCLECGLDITQRARVFTCPDCGSLFCSAGCYREHRYHAHPSRGR